MNYDCSRPTSRVSKPPGGGSSNIFGDAVPITKPDNVKSNPSFQSSVFGKAASKESQQNVKEKSNSTTNSNIPMFTPNVRPKTAPYTRGTGLERSSKVFKDLAYPTDPRFEPGVQGRPKSACKPFSPTTKSHIFGNNTPPPNEAKKIPNNNLTFQSSVFTPDPEKEVSSRPVSRTFETTVNNKSEKASLFVKRKLSDKPYSRSLMKGSSCDVIPQENTTIMSSGFVKTTLKPKALKPFENDEKKGNPLFRSCGNLITSSGNSIVHFKCHEKKELNNSYKSEGVKNSNDGSTDGSLKLWSCDLKPSQITSGIGKGSRSYKSHIFQSDKKNPESSCIWSSDFKKASFQSRKLNQSNNTVSTVFLAPKPLVAKNSGYVSKTYLSTIFT